MTREEAIEMLKKDKEQRGNCFISDALDMAIKALEQESVIDKIRAEIESITPKAHIRTGKLSIDTELMIPLDRVLKVIDKYKAESDPQESMRKRNER